ncbi:MAG: hypothetical protein IJ240_07880 [Clostridia bacterium]|nr:hypothetical protein [Clostridia bacterium]
MADSLNVEQLTAKAEELIKKFTSDGDLKAAFLKDPVATLEKTLGIDLPDEQINQLISLVQEKIGEAGAKSILDKVKGFFK